MPKESIIFNIYKHIDDLHISDGETRRMSCPNCGQKTFTITNNMGKLLWNCYRLSCNVSGHKRVRLTADEIKNRHMSNNVNETFELPTYVVPHRENIYMDRWCATWGLDINKLNLLYDVKETRVVFPIVHNNILVDATGRALGNRKPKWKRYGKSGLPYTHGCGKVAVVVEDCVSAAVIGGYKSFVGVALLGTSLQEGHKGYLSQFSTAVIALDPDALRKNLKIANELRGYVNDVRVLRLTDDLKYRNPTDMEKLNGIITN